jgi:NaMN:DMB phosphoribosyltransferase
MSMRPERATTTGLHALVAAIKRSPIVVHLAGRLSRAAQWAIVRKSPDVDAFVLAGIASEARGRSRRPRLYN